MSATCTMYGPAVRCKKGFVDLADFKGAVFAALHNSAYALRVISRQRSTSVAFGAKRTFSEPLTGPDFMSTRPVYHRAPPTRPVRAWKWVRSTA